MDNVYEEIGATQNILRPTIPRRKGTSTLRKSHFENPPLNNNTYKSSHPSSTQIVPASAIGRVNALVHLTVGLSRGFAIRGEGLGSGSSSTSEDAKQTYLRRFHS